MMNFYVYTLNSVDESAELYFVSVEGSEDAFCLTRTVDLSGEETWTKKEVSLADFRRGDMAKEGIDLRTVLKIQELLG